MSNTTMTTTGSLSSIQWEWCYLSDVFFELKNFNKIGGEMDVQNHFNTLAFLVLIIEKEIKIEKILEKKYWITSGRMKNVCVFMEISGR